jgi:uncharacterized protein (DUF1778 family)
MVRRAAEIEGRTVSDFVVDAAQQAARKTIEETHIIRLAADDQLRFAQLLLDPAPLSMSARASIVACLRSTGISVSR